MKSKGSLLKQEVDIEVSANDVEGFKKPMPRFIQDSIGILNDKVEFERWKRAEEINLLKKHL